MNILKSTYGKIQTVIDGLESKRERLEAELKAIPHTPELHEPTDPAQTICLAELRDRIHGTSEAATIKANHNQALKEYSEAATRQKQHQAERDRINALLSTNQAELAEASKLRTAERAILLAKAAEKARKRHDKLLPEFLDNMLELKALSMNGADIFVSPHFAIPIIAGNREKTNPPPSGFFDQGNWLSLDASDELRRRMQEFEDGLS